jgi:Leucine-rich repeat (LRR) protein
VQYNALRTDSEYYTPFRESGIEQTNHPAGLRALRYCTELRALDLGHSQISDTSYLAYMPHLQYLILAECYTPDLTPVGELKELKWLELFQNTAADVSPLLGCTALEDFERLLYLHAQGQSF